MAMAGLAGASWHAGLSKVAIVASKRGGEVPNTGVCVSIQVHFFLFVYQPKMISAYSDDRGEDVPPMSQRSVNTPPAVLSNNWVLGLIQR